MEAFLQSLTGWEDFLSRIVAIGGYDNGNGDGTAIDFQDVIAYGLKQGWDAQEGLDQFLVYTVCCGLFYKEVTGVVRAFVRHGAVLDFDLLFNWPRCEYNCGILIDRFASYYGLDPLQYGDWPNIHAAKHVVFDDIASEMLRTVDLQALKYHSKFLQDPSQWPRTRAMEACKTIKEELMAKAWHPERLQRWLEQGYDPDD
jgi:hypothetical protein